MPYGRRRPWKCRVVLASDLGLDLNATPHGQGESLTVLLGQPWHSEGGEPAPGSSSCEVCGGAPLGDCCYCARCDAYFLDGEELLPGLPVGRYPDKEWKPDETDMRRGQKRTKLRHHRPGKLKGGLGA